MSNAWIDDEFLTNIGSLSAFKSARTEERIDVWETTQELDDTAFLSELAHAKYQPSATSARNSTQSSADDYLEIDAAFTEFDFQSLSL